MSPNTPTEDVLLDLYLMLLKAGSQLYLFNEIVGFMEKNAGHTDQKGVALPHRETLIKQMQQKHNIPAPVPIPIVQILLNKCSSMLQYPLLLQCCSYHLTGNADNNGTLPNCPCFHHDPMEIPEPSSNYNTLHLDKAYDGAYFPLLEKF
jgi:hypothetical protein